MKLKMAIGTALTFVIGCGDGGTAVSSPRSEIAASSSALLIASGQGDEVVAVSATVVAGNDQQNARCLSAIRLIFNKPIAIATMLGKVTLNSTFHHKRPFNVERYNRNYNEFLLSAQPIGNCLDPQDRQEIMIADTVRSADGQKLSRSVVLPLTFLLNIDNVPTLPREVVLPVPADINWEAPANAGSSTTESESNTNVTANELNLAFGALQSFADRERKSPLYQQSGVISLTTADGILQSAEPQFSSRQYGTADTFYVLRRAAKFVKELFADQTSVMVVDISDQDGQTPAVIEGSGKVLLHPRGSHEGGKDVDVAYIEYPGATAQNSGTSKAYNMEKNFWFLYQVLQSSSVDLVITAYKAEFIAMAQRLYQQGVITDIAAGRFNVLMEDHELNHDKHMHINIGNAANKNVSRKFLAVDDVYNCYLSLSPQIRGGVFNFCSD